MHNSKTASNITLILANLVPLFGVLFLGWDGKSVFVIYILETVFIGLVNVLKMLTVYFLNGTKNEPPLSPGNNIGGLFIIPFFMFHYNFFIFVQSAIFFGFSSIWDRGAPDAFDLAANFAPYFTGQYQIAIMSLTAANLFYFVNDFIVTGEYRNQSMAGLMFQPYKRIILQQFVVIFGGFIFMMTGGMKLFIVLFVALKIVADYIGANYSNNPRIKSWVMKKVSEKATTVKEVEDAEKSLDALLGNSSKNK